MSEVTVPRPLVEEAVKTAFGPKARVFRHQTKTLTAPGDNFATTVVCLQVDLETSPDKTQICPKSNVRCVEARSENGISNDSESKILEPLSDGDSISNGTKEVSGTRKSAVVRYEINARCSENCITTSDTSTDSGDRPRAGNTPNTKAWTCIAKTNSKKESIFFKIFSKFAFDNEVRFYTILLPALNEELSKSKVSHLKVPDYYYSHKEEDNELLIMEDLRRSGFAMGDKSKGLDSQRCIEVARELAKLHSASVLVKRNHSKMEKIESSCGTRAEKLPSCADKLNGDGCSDGSANQHGSEARCFALEVISAESYLVKDGPIMNIFGGLAQDRITNALNFLSKKPGTEKAVSWLKSIEADIPAFLRRMLVDCDPKFLVLCHGGTWTNNFLFSPSLDAVSMVDFQIIRPSSLAADLNYLLYTSHLGYFTPTNVQIILDAYYTEFETILGAQGYQMPFTRDALSAEVEAKKPWGVMGGVVTLPMLFPQQQGGEGTESASSESGETVERIRNNSKKSDPEETNEVIRKENDVEEGNNLAAAEKETRVDPKGTSVGSSNDLLRNQETETGAGDLNVKEPSAGKHAEVPCNFTFEEKFLQLFKNITW